MRWLLRCVSVLIFCVVAVSKASAQQEQKIELHPGWNAVYLRVAPDQPKLPEAIAGLPIDRIAMHLDNSGAPEFITDPANHELQTPEWLVYLAQATTPNDGAALNKMIGGRVYLILVRGNQSVTWTVPGTPVLKKISWRSNDYTLTGLSVASGSARKFSDYFAGSGHHGGPKGKRLGADGRWMDLAGDKDVVGESEAYWLFTEGASTYQGPLDLALPNQTTRLEVGGQARDTEIEVRNNLTTPQEVTLSAVDSTGAAGLLSYWSGDFGESEKTWQPLLSDKSFTLAPSETRKIRLAANPSAGTAAAKVINKTEGDTGGNGTLKVSGSSGGQFTVNLIAKATASSNPLPGLWVGEVVLDRVSEHVRRSDGSATPQLGKTAGSPFQFRLILFVDTAYTARLLPQVTQVLENNLPVLYTDDKLFSKYQPASTIPADARRLSSAAFGVFLSPVTDADTPFPAPGVGATLDMNLTLKFDDPLNPFMHIYHPDHNNLDGYDREFTSAGQLAEIEAFTVTRAIRLAFSTTIKPGLGVETGDPNYGASVWTGDYQETIAGLMRDTTEGLSGSVDNKIVVNGTFVLRHVSSVTTLNPNP